MQTTIDSFKRICAGEFDHLPEQAFYMVGPLTEVQEKAEKILKETAQREAAKKAAQQQAKA